MLRPFEASNQSAKGTLIWSSEKEFQNGPLVAILYFREAEISGEN